MKKILLFIIALLALNTVKADEFLVRDRTCTVRYHSNNDRLQPAFLKYLEQKNYRPKVITPESPAYDGELMAGFDKEHLSGKVFRDCKIELKLWRHGEKGSDGLSRMILNHRTVRQLPRITFKGHERCSRGLRDAFLHLPPCSTRTP
jgi:hypothetical protein